MVLQQFNPGKKSWKIYANEIKSISGDDLIFTSYYNKNILLEVSGNGLIQFKENNKIYNLSDLSNNNDVDLNIYDDASFGNVDISGNTTILSTTPANILSNQGALSVMGGINIRSTQEGITDPVDPNFGNIALYCGGGAYIQKTVFIGDGVNDANLYIQKGNLSITGNMTINSGKLEGDINNNNNLLIASNLIPDTNLNYNIGTSAYKFNNLYIDNIYTSTLNVENNRIEINANNSNDGGIDVNFANGSTKSLYYDNINSEWKTNNTNINIGTANFIGDGSQLTGISTSLVNYDDASFGNIDVSGRLSLSTGFLNLDDGVINFYASNNVLTGLDDSSGIIQKIEDLSNSLSNISLQNYNDVSFGNIEFSGNIIPSIDDTFDIGSVDKKVRDIYVSNNTIYIGDVTTLGIDNSGNFIVRKRKTDVIPSGLFNNVSNPITDKAVLLADINLKLGTNFSSLNDVKLGHWKRYSKSIRNNVDRNINEIFQTSHDEDWEEIKGLSDTAIIQGQDASFGNIDISGILKTDFIFNKTDGSGVVIGGSIKILGSDLLNANVISASNYNVGNKNVISASAQGCFTDLELKNNNGTKLLIDGDSGDIQADGILYIDNINEKTNLNGVNIESINIKGSDITGVNSISATNYAVGSVNIISAARQANFRDLELKNNSNQVTLLADGDTGDISMAGTLLVNNIKGGSTMVIDPAVHNNNTGKLVIKGDLEVQGATTNINSTTLDISDNRIKLNASTSTDAGIDISFTDGTSKSFYYNKSDNKWKTDNTSLDVGSGIISGNITGDVTGHLTGDVLGNVTGNLTGNVTGNVTGDITGDVTGNLTGNVTGNVTGDVTGNLTGNVTGNLTGNVTGDVTGQVSSLSNFKTDDLTEGVNLYYTDARVDNRISSSILLNNISDVDTNGVNDGYVLKYDSSTSKWIPGIVDISSGSNTNNTTNNTNNTNNNTINTIATDSTVDNLYVKKIFLNNKIVIDNSSNNNANTSFDFRYISISGDNIIFNDNKTATITPNNSEEEKEKLYSFANLGGNLMNQYFNDNGFTAVYSHRDYLGEGSINVPVDQGINILQAGDPPGYIRKTLSGNGKAIIKIKQAYPGNLNVPNGINIYVSLNSNIVFATYPVNEYHREQKDYFIELDFKNNDILEIGEENGDIGIYYIRLIYNVKEIEYDFSNMESEGHFRDYLLKNDFEYDYDVFNVIEAGIDLPPSNEAITIHSNFEANSYIKKTLKGNGTIIIKTWIPSANPGNGPDVLYVKRNNVKEYVVSAPNTKNFHTIVLDFSNNDVIEIGEDYGIISIYNIKLIYDEINYNNVMTTFNDKIGIYNNLGNHISLPSFVIGGPFSFETIFKYPEIQPVGGWTAVIGIYDSISNWRIELSRYNNTKQLQFFTFNDTAVEKILTNDNVLNGDYLHVIVVHKNTPSSGSDINKEIYINGTLITNITHTGSENYELPNHTYNYYNLGKSIDGDNEELFIKYVNYYDKALTSEEITNLSAKGIIEKSIHNYDFRLSTISGDFILLNDNNIARAYPDNSTTGSSPNVYLTDLSAIHTTTTSFLSLPTFKTSQKFSLEIYFRMNYLTNIDHESIFHIANTTPDINVTIGEWGNNTSLFDHTKTKYNISINQSWAGQDMLEMWWNNGTTNESLTYAQILYNGDPNSFNTDATFIHLVITYDSLTNPSSGVGKWYVNNSLIINETKSILIPAIERQFHLLGSHVNNTKNGQEETQFLRYYDYVLSADEIALLYANRTQTNTSINVPSTPSVIPLVGVTTTETETETETTIETIIDLSLTHIEVSCDISMINNSLNLKSLNLINISGLNKQIDQVITQSVYTLSNQADNSSNTLTPSKNYDFRTVQISSNNLTFSSGLTGQVVGGSATFNNINGITRPNNVNVSFDPYEMNYKFAYEIVFKYDSLSSSNSWSRIFSNYTTNYHTTFNGYHIFFSQFSNTDQLVFEVAKGTNGSHVNAGYLTPSLGYSNLQNFNHFVIIFDGDIKDNHSISAYGLIPTKILMNGKSLELTIRNDVYSSPRAGETVVDASFITDNYTLGRDAWGFGTQQTVKYLNYYDNTIQLSDANKLFNDYFYNIMEEKNLWIHVDPSDTTIVNKGTGNFTLRKTILDTPASIGKNSYDRIKINKVYDVIEFETSDINNNNIYHGGFQMTGLKNTMSNSNFTIAAWVNPTSYKTIDYGTGAHRGRIILFSNSYVGGTGVNLHFRVYLYRDPANSLNDFGDHNVDGLCVTSGDATLITYSGIDLDNNSIINKWFHIAIVKNTSSIQLYINGNLVGSYTGGSNLYLSNNSSELTFGSSSYIANIHDETRQSFMGYMQDILVDNTYAFKEEEVMVLYNHHPDPVNKIFPKPTKKYDFRNFTTNSLNNITFYGGELATSYGTNNFSYTDGAIMLTPTYYLALEPFLFGGTYSFETVFKFGQLYNNWERIFDFGSGAPSNNIFLAKNPANDKKLILSLESRDGTGWPATYTHQYFVTTNDIQKLDTDFIHFVLVYDSLNWDNSGAVKMYIDGSNIPVTATQTSGTAQFNYEDLRKLTKRTYHYVCRSTQHTNGFGASNSLHIKYLNYFSYKLTNSNVEKLYQLYSSPEFIFYNIKKVNNSITFQDANYATIYGLSQHNVYFKDYCLALNGDNFALMPSFPTTDTFSIEMYFSLYKGQTDHNIFSMFNLPPSLTTSNPKTPKYRWADAYKSTNINNYKNFNIQRDGDTNNLKIYSTNANDGSQSGDKITVTTTSPLDISENQFVHFVYTHDNINQTCKVFINGVESEVNTSNNGSYDYTIDTIERNVHLLGNYNQVSSAVTPIYNYDFRTATLNNDNGLISFNNGLTANLYTTGIDYPTLTTETGIEGRVDSYVSLTPINIDTEFTMEAYFTMDMNYSGSNSNSIWGMWDNVNAENTSSTNGPNSRSNIMFERYGNNSHGYRLGIWSYGTNNSTYQAQDTAHTSDFYDTFRHYVIVFTQTSRTFYIDGVLKPPDNITNAANYTFRTGIRDQFILGRTAWFDSGTENIKFLRYYNRALNATEIQNLYNSREETSVEALKFKYFKMHNKVLQQSEITNLYNNIDYIIAGYVVTTNEVTQTTYISNNITVSSDIDMSNNTLICKNIDINSGLKINNDCGSDGNVLISQGLYLPPKWVQSNSIMNYPFNNIKNETNINKLIELNFRSANLTLGTEISNNLYDISNTILTTNDNNLKWNDTQKAPPNDLLFYFGTDYATYNNDGSVIFSNSSGTATEVGTVSKYADYITTKDNVNGDGNILKLTPFSLTGSITFEVYFKFHFYSNTQRVFQFGSEITWSQHMVYLAVAHNSDKIDFVFFSPDFGNNTKHIEVSSLSAIGVNLSQWTHIVIVEDEDDQSNTSNQTLKLYFNGVLYNNVLTDNPDNYDLIDTTERDEYAIGTGQNPGYTPSLMDIRYLNFYRSAKTQAEITELYNNRETSVPLSQNNNENSSSYNFIPEYHTQEWGVMKPESHYGSIKIDNSNLTITSSSEFSIELIHKKPLNSIEYPNSVLFSCWNRASTDSKWNIGEEGYYNRICLSYKDNTNKFLAELINETGSTLTFESVNECLYVDNSNSDTLLNQAKPFHLLFSYNNNPDISCSLYVDGISYELIKTVGGNQNNNTNGVFWTSDITPDEIHFGVDAKSDTNNYVTQPGSTWSYFSLYNNNKVSTNILTLNKSQYYKQLLTDPTLYLKTFTPLLNNIKSLTGTLDGTSYDYINATSQQHVKASWDYTSSLSITDPHASMRLDGGLFISSKAPITDQGGNKHVLGAIGAQFGGTPTDLEVDFMVEGTSMLIGDTYIGPNGNLVLFGDILSNSGQTILGTGGIVFETELSVWNEDTPKTYSSGGDGEVLVSQGQGKPPKWIPLESGGGGGGGGEDLILKYPLKTAQLYGPSTNSEFGSCTIINDSGTRIAIGVTGLNLVKIYEWTSGSWTQMGSDINAPTGWWGAKFGRTLDFDDLGNNIIIGSPHHYGGGGGAYVFQWNGSSWLQKGANIIPASSHWWSFGSQVCMNSDGSIILVSAKNADDGSTRFGRIYAYQWNGSSWVDYGNSPAARGNTPQNGGTAFMGHSLKLSPDGNTFITGAPGWTGHTATMGYLQWGHFVMYTLQNGTWTNVQITYPSIPRGWAEGVGIGITGTPDLDKIAVATGGHNIAYHRTGAIYMLKRDGNDYVPYGNNYIIEGEGGQGDYFGSAGDYSSTFPRTLKLSNDGTVLAVASILNEANYTASHSNVGQVRVYKYSGESWSLMFKTLFGENASDYFGALDLTPDGTKLIVGASQSGVGNGYIKTYDLTEYTTTKLSANASVIGVGNDVDLTTHESSHYSNDEIQNKSSDELKYGTQGQYLVSGGHSNPMKWISKPYASFVRPWNAPQFTIVANSAWTEINWTQVKFSSGIYLDSGGYHFRVIRSGAYSISVQCRFGGGDCWTGLVLLDKDEDHVGRGIIAQSAGFGTVNNGSDVVNLNILAEINETQHCVVAFYRQDGNMTIINPANSNVGHQMVCNITCVS